VQLVSSKEVAIANMMAESFACFSTIDMHLLLKFCLALSARSIPAVPTVEAGEGREMMIAGGLLLLLGLTCDVYVLFHFAFSQKNPPPDGHLMKVGPKPWDIPELILTASALLVVFLLSNAFYWLVAIVTHHAVTQLVSLVITTEVFLRVGILVVCADFMRRRNLNLSSAFGLRALPPLDAISWGIVFGLASIPPVQLLIVTSEKLFRAVGFKPSEQPIAALFATTDSRLLLSLLVVFAVVIAPMFEEVFFRGFAYPTLKQRLGAWPAMLIVSAIFALSHAHLPSLVPLFALAIGLALAYELTGSLFVPIGMHALFNAVMVAKLFIERMQS
jgi:hypothetical protein